MKYWFSILLLASVGLFFFSCEDYIEKGIEGQWQMTKVVEADGAEHKVDSIFYLFKKGVFKYMRMETGLDSFYAFGAYAENNNKLELEIKEFWSECNGDCLHWGENTFERTYDIKKKTSSALELEFNGEVYVFRKY
ncbi:lipocalin-like domain-containing protein [Viscerimonas tarda]